jgi:hypothetical protein
MTPLVLAGESVGAEYYRSSEISTVFLKSIGRWRIVVIVVRTV